MTFSLAISFSTGNIIGPLAEGVNVFPSAAVLVAFESISWNTSYGNGNDPDTLLYGFVDFGGPFWDTSAEAFRIVFTPSAPSVIQVDTSTGPTPMNFTHFVDMIAQEISYDWLGEGKEITVVPCSLGALVNGDADFNRTVTAADIIYLVNHAFKSGPEPIIWNLGDVNCDGVIAAADLVQLVGYVFKSGAEPCDVCSTL